MSTDRILVHQAGVIARHQALAAGVSADAIDHRLRRRHWRPLHPRVYLAAGHRVDDEVRVRAAMLWAGEGAVLSGVAAAWWHGVADRAPATIVLTVDRGRHPRSRPGVAVRRRTLAPTDLETRRGLAVTARPLTVLEAAVELGAPGSELLDRALRRWVRFPAVHEAYCRNTGACGGAGAGRMLAAAADRSAPVAERLLVRMLRESGARGWRRGRPALGSPSAVAFPAVRVAVEVDGWAWHMDAARTRADRCRRTALVRQGWTVLRYTWHDLVGRPHAVLAEIARAVTRGEGVDGARRT